MNKLLFALLGMSLGGSVMGLLLLIFRPLLHRQRRHTALYYLYLPVLLRLLLPLPGFLPLTLPPASGEVAAAPVQDTASVLPVHYAPSEEKLSPAISMADTSPYLSDSGEADSPALTQELLSANGTPTAPPSSSTALYAPVVSPSPSPSPTLTLPRPTLAAVISGIYLLGVAIALFISLRGYARFVRAVRCSGRRAPEYAYDLLSSLDPRSRVGLLCSPAAPVPMLIGLRRSLIVLPPDAVAAEDLGDVLRHELTHCRRWDLPYKWLMQLTLCFHWFNPLLYILRRSMAEDCELSCDEMLIRRMNAQERQHYGETLIRLSSHPHLSPSLPATTLSEGKEQLRERLLSIMRGASARPAALLYLLCALLLCGCGALFGGGKAGESSVHGQSASVPPQITWERGTVLRQGEQWSTDGNIWYQTGAVVYDRDGLYTTDGSIWYFDGYATRSLYPDAPYNKLGRWSTDGNIWYCEGQTVYDSSGLYTTDGNVWYSYGFWTTGGNTRYSIPYSVSPYVTDTRLTLYTTDGNISEEFCDTVTVSNVDELLSALRGNTIVQLLPGVYDFTQATVDYYPSIHWKPVGGEQSMRTTQLYNTSIRGATGDPADVVLRFGSGDRPGLLLEQCYSINFQHLTFVSENDMDNPGSILQLNQCSGLYFGNCAFASCGGSAIFSTNSSYITLENCSFAPTGRGNIYLENSNAPHLQGCTFDSTGGVPPTFRDCLSSLLEDCTLDGVPVEQGDLLLLGDYDFY